MAYYIYLLASPKHGVLYRVTNWYRWLWIPGLRQAAHPGM